MSKHDVSKPSGAIVIELLDVRDRVEVPDERGVGVVAWLAEDLALPLAGKWSPDPQGRIDAAILQATCASVYEGILACVRSEALPEDHQSRPFRWLHLFETFPQR